MEGLLKYLKQLYKLVVVAAGDDEGPKQVPRQCSQLTHKLLPTPLVQTADSAASTVAVAEQGGSDGAVVDWLEILADLDM